MTREQLLIDLGLFAQGALGALIFYLIINGLIFGAVALGIPLQ